VADVGEPTARVWGLYMAGSRLGFETNVVQLHQVLAVKPAPNGDASFPLRPTWLS
jgi:cyclopropane-fatty-acyl-phospholipid synthase